ncbi:RNA polymerase sigma-70 factor [uncultured Arcticibacterium sp.]|uniref:RNA polymerase sigma-70 factor n=1 Tax=uncultured Arcticibacterium sp. TaxID=2173042 RepID=UPI0030F57BAE
MFALAKPILENLQETEQSYLLEIRKGNKSAFKRVFDTYYADLSRYAFSMLKRQEEAEDLVQQVFVNFWEKREQTIISGSLKSYLFRSVHNQSLNLIKHEKVKASYVQHSQFFDIKYQSDVEETLEGKELEIQIAAAIETLPKQCQKIFVMNRMESLKYKEIAEQLGISIKTVENQIGKALKILRSSLAPYLVSLLLICLGL